MSTVIRRALACLPIACLALSVLAASPRGVDRLAYALTGARVIVAPGKIVDPGIVVVRGGVLEAVGPAGTTAIPADARVLDMKGRVLFAAFLDPNVSTDRLAGKSPSRPKDDDDTPATEPPPAGQARPKYERYRSRPKAAPAAPEAGR